MNITLGALLCGIVIPLDRMLTADSFALRAAIWLLALPIAYGSYRAAVGAASRWGTEVRSSIDLHWLELVDHLGVRRPQSRDEMLERSRAINRLLLYAEPIPDAIRT